MSPGIKQSTELKDRLLAIATNALDNQVDCAVVGAAAAVFYGELTAIIVSALPAAQRARYFACLMRVAQEQHNAAVAIDAFATLARETQS